MTGTLSYEHYLATSSGLDYANPELRPVRGVTVIARRAADGFVVDDTVSDQAGSFSLSVPSGISIQLAVQAAHGSRSDQHVQVLNPSNGALWTVTSTIAVGTADLAVDLEIPGGWNGTDGYLAGERLSGPFAILDAIYDCEQLVRSADGGVSFPLLRAYWQPGGLVGSNYRSDSRAMWIRGAEGEDTDEFDSAVVMHEWAHYYEDVFSRSDSLGDEHYLSDQLDDTLAFGEGFGNAFAGIVLDSTGQVPLYLDTKGARQEQIQVSINTETKATASEWRGYWNEVSVLKVLYDLYDDNDDGETLALGFAPIHEVMTGPQRSTVGFTSLYSFLHHLKQAYTADPATVAAIDAIAQMEDVSPSLNEFGDDIPAIERHYITFSFDPNASQSVTTDPTGAALQTHGTYLSGSIGWPGNKWLQRWLFRGTALAAGTYDLVVTPLGPLDGDGKVTGILVLRTPGGSDLVPNLDDENLYVVDTQGVPIPGAAFELQVEVAEGGELVFAIGSHTGEVPFKLEATKLPVAGKISN